MSAADKLARMGACPEAVNWIGTRTIEQAWRECKRSEWMCWLLRRIAHNDPRFRLAAADFAERAWSHITDEGTKLAAAWAIDVARRMARGEVDEDERIAARDAADAAAAAAYADAAYTDAAYTDAAYTDAAAAAAYIDAAAAAEAAAHIAAERRAQAGILRGYFSAKEIGQLFAKVTP